jgi:23S rRNA (cytosine1962-C5)-methyltransferase
VLSGAVETTTGTPGPGEVVLVRDHEGRAIGRGFFAPSSAIRVRMLTRNPVEEIDDAFLVRRIRRAVELRRRLGLFREEVTAYRLVHADGDGLPGVVADRFGEHVVLQLTVRGMEDRRTRIAEILAAEAGVKGVRLRRVPAFEAGEGLVGAEGDLLPTPVPEKIEVRENGVKYLVSPASGQKTGHYLDHRENRALLSRFVRDLRVLDAFTGTGGFAIAAARAGAREVTGIDSSGAALAAAGLNAEANGVEDRVRFLRDDVFAALRSFEAKGESFDVVCLDPPRMASRKRDLRRALKGYKELNLRAMRLLVPGGVLATASCTGLVDGVAFERTLRDAALDAERELKVLYRTGQGPDHPWSIVAPESRYLEFVLGEVFPL